MFFELKYGCVPFKNMPSFPNRALSVTSNFMSQSRMLGKYFARPKKQLSLYEKDYIEEFAVIAEGSKLSSLFYNMMHPRENKRPKLSTVALCLQEIIRLEQEEIVHSPMNRSRTSDLDVRLTHSSGFSTDSSSINLELEKEEAPVRNQCSRIASSLRSRVALTRDKII